MSAQQTSAPAEPASTDAGADGEVGDEADAGAGVAGGGHVAPGDGVEELVVRRHAGHGLVRRDRAAGAVAGAGQGRRRDRWRRAKAAGHALTYWQQGQRGWEKKAG